MGGTFEGKVVIVTGASSGIGAETAKSFHKAGALLCVTGRNVSHLKEVASECGGALMVVGDFAAEADLGGRIIEETLKTYERIDVLINNAGSLENGSIEDTSLEQFDRIFDLNVRAVYGLTMLAVPHLIKSKGTIVNVSSVCGLRAFPGVLSYCMSKSALDQFTRCTALELAPKGVRVNAVNPGVIVTQLHRRGGLDDQRYKEFLDKCQTTHALGRPGTVQEVAAAILFLASDNASFITGETLSVDGGRHAMCPR